MRNPWPIFTIVGALLILAEASPALAQSAQSCSPGKYAGVATPDGRQGVPVVVSIDCASGRMGGSIQSPLGPMAITGGSSSGDAIHAIAAAEGATIDLRRDGEHWRGSFSAGGGQGRLDLERNDAANYDQMVAEPVERLDLSPDQWRDDLKFVAGQVPKAHKNAFHRISAAQWTQAVHALDQQLAGLRPIEVPPALAALVAEVGDGHTSIRLPHAGRRLPILMFWFGDELRIIRTIPAYRSLLGAQVIAIGGASAATAAARVAREDAHENRWGDLAATPYLLRREDVLVWAGLASGDTVSLKVKLANGAVRTQAISFVDANAKTEPLWIAGQPPLQLQRPDDGLWWQDLGGKAILYVNFRGYGQLAGRTNALMQALDARRPAKLVIDMRDNGGGDFDLFRQTMLKAIVARPWLNQHGRLFVIVGREMFSAAMTNAVDFETKTNAIVVGEPIGERPNSYQEVRFFYLPNSHLRLGVSTEYYKTVAGDPSAVFPQVMKPPTWGAFRRGGDDALDWIEAFR